MPRAYSLIGLGSAAFISPAPRSSPESSPPAPPPPRSSPPAPHEYRAWSARNRNPHPPPLERPRRQTPTGRLDLGNRHRAAQSGHRRELGVRKAGKQPIRLPLEIRGQLELIDNILAARIELFGKASDGAAIPGIVVARRRILLGRIHHARRELTNQVHILNKAPATGSQFRKLGLKLLLPLERRPTLARIGSLAISRRLRRMGGACFSLPGERSSPRGLARPVRLTIGRQLPNLPLKYSNPTGKGCFIAFGDELANRRIGG